MLESRTTLAGISRGTSKTAPSKQAVRLRLYAELMLLDCVAVFVGFLVAGSVGSGHWVSPSALRLGTLMVPLFLTFAITKNAYSIEILEKPLEGVHHALTALLLTTITVVVIGFMLHASEMVSRLAFVSGVLGSIALQTLGRVFFSFYARTQIGESAVSEIVIADGVPYVGKPGTLVINAQMAQIEADAGNPVMIERLGYLLQGFDRAIIVCVPERRATWSLLLKGANVVGEILVPQFNEIGAIGLSTYSGEDTILVSRGPLSMPNRAKKRALDLLFTTPVLIALTPILLLIALAIKIDSPGPVFFKQSRVGRGNRMFKIFKFRSMYHELSDSTGSRSARRDDDRITRVGAFIRKTSIDELPQLINVLLGDMSLVGPRPHALGSLAGDKLFWEVDEHYWRRHALKPGITGLAQIRGFRGATHEFTDLENRLRADLEYIVGWHLWRDVSILLSTIKVIVHRNAY